MVFKIVTGLKEISISIKLLIVCAYKTLDILYIRNLKEISEINARFYKIMCISIFFIYKKLIFQLREFTVDTKAFVMLYYDFVVYFRSLS